MNYKHMQMKANMMLYCITCYQQSATLFLGRVQSNMSSLNVWIFRFASLYIKNTSQ